MPVRFPRYKTPSNWFIVFAVSYETVSIITSEIAAFENPSIPLNTTPAVEAIVKSTSLSL